MGAFFRTARAMVIRCCSPPDRYTPFAPITVSIPSGSFSMISVHWAASSERMTSSLVACGFAMRTFSSTDALIRRLSWKTKDTLSISVSFGIFRISVFPINILPSWGSKNLAIIFARVVFPPPDGPTSAAFCPGAMDSDTSLSAFFLPSPPAPLFLSVS